MSEIGFVVYKKARIEDLEPKNKEKKKKGSQPQSNERNYLLKVKEIFPEMDDKMILSVLEKADFSVVKAVEFLTTYGEKEQKAQAKEFTKTPSQKEDQPISKSTPPILPKASSGGESANPEDENDDIKSILMEYEQSIYEDNEDREEYDSTEFNRIFNDLLREFERENSITGTAGSQNEKNKDLLKMCEEEICWWLKVQPAFVEESNLDDLDEEFFESNEEVVQKVQLFIMDLIQFDQVKKNKELVHDSKSYLQGFPSLGDANKSRATDQDSFNILEKITKNEEEAMERRRKEEEKLGSKGYLKFGTGNSTVSRSQWNKTNMSLFHTNKHNSQEEVKKLSDHFPSIDLKVLKFIYMQLGEDFETSRNFLMKNYGSQFQQQKKAPPKKPQQRAPVDSDSDDESYKREELLAKDLDDANFTDIRAQVMRHMRLKYILSKTAQKSATMNKHSDASKLRNMAKNQEVELEAYMAASKRHFLEKLRRNNNFHSIDLHGFFLEEALNILSDQIRFIRNKLKSNQVKNPVFQDYRGQRCLSYEIITGKGLHSKNRKPVLTPGVVQFLKDKNYFYQPRESEGKIYLYLPF